MVLKGIMETLYPNSFVTGSSGRKRGSRPSGPELSILSSCKGVRYIIEGENPEHGFVYSLELHCTFPSSSNKKKNQQQKKTNCFAFQLTITVQIFFKFSMFLKGFVILNHHHKYIISSKIQCLPQSYKKKLHLPIMAGV